MSIIGSGFVTHEERETTMKPVLSYMTDTEIREEMAHEVNAANRWNKEFSRSVQTRDNRVMQSVTGTAHTQRAIMLQNEMLIRQNDEIIRLLKKIGGEEK